MAWKLHTENLPGNLHMAATEVNRLGWSRFVLQMHSTGNYTIVVFRMPARLVNKIRRNNPSYASPVNHDDPPFWPRLYNAQKAKRYAEGYGAGKKKARSAFWLTFWRKL